MSSARATPRVDAVRWLAIDTSGGTTVGVVDCAGDVPDGGVPQEMAVRNTDDARSHVEALTPLIAACLEESGTAVADLDAVVVGTGPAPFTGLRVGIASAAAFARAAGLPVHGVSSLDAIAWSRPSSTVVVTDARRREVYWAAYAAGAGPHDGSRRVHGPAVGPASDVAAYLAEHGADVVGAGVGLHPELAGDAAARVRPADLVGVATSLLATGAPTPLTPLYLRRPDIHVGGARKRAS